jgi:hypothetical protein
MTGGACDATFEHASRVDAGELFYLRGSRESTIHVDGKATP